MIPLKDNQPSRHFPIMTVLLIALNVYVFYLELTSANLNKLIFHYALIPSLIDLHNPFTWYRFVSSMFLHGGFLHIISNMLFLWVFGDNVEDRFGWAYVPIYLLGGIAGGLAQYLLMPTTPLPVIGASGGVATVLGAYFIFYPNSKIATLVPIFFFITVIQLPALAILAYWFLLQVFNGVTSITSAATDAGGVAYFAHIAGFLSGVVYALAFGGRQANLTYDSSS